jgi:precorrin-6A/cobalt-precorrin-6A reductase
MTILILGGTSEASTLAALLAGRPDLPACLSYAGRVRNPMAQPIPTRVGGFGGVDGLVRYVRGERIRAIVDATHPFAAQMTAHAMAAARETGTPLLRLTRPAWQAELGDHWIPAANMDAAVSALPALPARVFVALGRNEIAVLQRAPQHHYVLRMVDPPDAPLSLPSHEIIVARGPFTGEHDAALLANRRIDLVMAKNAGGAASIGKIVAARQFGVPVIMIARPAEPDGMRIVTEPDAAVRWLTSIIYGGTDHYVTS